MLGRKDLPRVAVWSRVDAHFIYLPPIALVSLASWMLDPEIKTLVFTSTIKYYALAYVINANSQNLTLKLPTRQAKKKKEQGTDNLPRFF